MFIWEVLHWQDPSKAGEQLREHKISIDKSLRCENKNINDDFDSAFGFLIYANLAQLVLFEEPRLISIVNTLL